jgi:hypothetical protein
MRFAIARSNGASPSGYSYFAGDITLQATDGEAAFVPSTTWMMEEAFAFSSWIDAHRLSDELRKRAPAHRDWMVLPHREDEP